MFGQFDPALLDDPQFKEDSVREVIIAPMLARLGYHPSGAARVIRSKGLVHPFIYAGTRKQPVTMVPDYTLLYQERPILILDAKRPTENILSIASVQQAYSYAIHPEIKCRHFALCNGKALAVFDVDHSNPVLTLPFEDFEPKWAEIESYLAPRFLLKPALRRFAPDLGLAFKRIGLAPDVKVTMFGVRLGIFARVSDELMTASSNCHFIDRPHMASFDFAPRFLSPILADLPTQLADAFRNSLSHHPFMAHGDLLIEADLEMTLGSPVEGVDETFVPFVIADVLGSRLNPELLPDDQPDFPANIFRLRDVVGIAPPDSGERTVPQPEK
jgi:hypothetical protein